jgi:hypothetical protein
LKALGFDPKGVGEELDGRKSRKTTSVASVETQGTLHSYFCYQSAVCRRPVRRTVRWNLKMLWLFLLLMLAWILCGFHVEREQQTTQPVESYPQPLLATAYLQSLLCLCPFPALVYVCLTVQVRTTFLTSVVPRCLLKEPGHSQAQSRRSLLPSRLSKGPGLWWSLIHCLPLRSWPWKKNERPWKRRHRRLRPLSCRLPAATRFPVRLLKGTGVPAATSFPVRLLKGTGVLLETGGRLRLGS